MTDNNIVGHVDVAQISKHLPRPELEFSLGKSYGLQAIRAMGFKLAAV